MTLQEENEMLRELLSEASDEIKMYAVRVDYEWGSCRTWEELVEQGEANDLALEIDDAISSNTEPCSDTLIEGAKALLALDEKGSLAPHGIGGLAREVIEKLIARVEHTAPQPEQSELVEALDSILSNLDENLPGCFTLESRGDFDAAAAIEQAHAALSAQRGEA